MDSRHRGRQIGGKVGQEKWDMTGLPTAPRVARDRTKTTQTTLGTTFKMTTTPAQPTDDSDAGLYFPPSPPSQ